MTFGMLVLKSCSEPDGVQVVPPFSFRFAFIEGFGSEHDAEGTGQEGVGAPEVHLRSLEAPAKMAQELPDSRTFQQHDMNNGNTTPVTRQLALGLS